MGKKEQSTIGVAAISGFTSAASSMATSQILNHSDKISDNEILNEGEEDVVDTTGENVDSVSSQATNVIVEGTGNHTSIDIVNNTTQSDSFESDPIGIEVEVIYGGPEVDDDITNIDIVGEIYGGPVDDIEVTDNYPDWVDDNLDVDLPEIQ